LLSIRPFKTFCSLNFDALFIGLAAGFLAVLTPTLAAAGNDISSIVHGGRLYDNWFEETREYPPEKTHPAYPARGAFAKKPAATWRCKECHGWDYRGSAGAYAKGRHYTGIKGIQGMAGADPAVVVAILKDDRHRYGPLMAPDNLMDIANFVSRGQVDMDDFIDRKTKKAKGNIDRNEEYFAVICANCHGRDGLKLSTMPPLGRIARDNPWETLHKIINGHPKEAMPALRAFNRQVLKDILAHAQTLPPENLLASITRGGRLYDNWDKETKGKVREVSHPAYPKSGTFARAPEMNWRCRECHGWDYKGKDGVFSSGRHFTGIKGIDGKSGADPAAIIDIITDETHRYTTLLDSRDLQDLANFVGRGQIHMERFIDPATGKVRGNIDRRRNYFETICANCHGGDGHRIFTMPSLGKFARTNPWRALHYMLNGHPDENMPALRMLPTQDLVDTLAFIQTLPETE